MDLRVTIQRSWVYGQSGGSRSRRPDRKVASGRDLAAFFVSIGRNAR
jgi:hypothetical protein